MFALFERQRFTICNSFANRDYPKDRRSYKVIEGDNREGCTKLSEQKFHLIGFPLILKANHCRRSSRHRYPRNEWMMYVHTYIHTYVCISKDYHQLCMIMPQLWRHNITLHDTRTGRQACSHCKILQIAVCVCVCSGGMMSERTSERLSWAVLYLYAFINHAHGHSFWCIYMTIKQTQTKMPVHVCLR